jgi:hypothetical protein
LRRRRQFRRFYHHRLLLFLIVPAYQNPLRLLNLGLLQSPDW